VRSWITPLMAGPTVWQLSALQSMLIRSLDHGS
jgi:hypothetical protein